MARLGSLLALALLASAVCAVPINKRPAAEHGRLSFAPAVESVHVRHVGEQVSFLTPGAASFGPVDALELGKNFAASVLEDSAALYRDFVVTDSYTTAHNGVTHVYLRQVVDGIPVVNSNMNINVGTNGAVISYGSSFYTGSAAAPSAAAFTGKTTGRASSFFSAAPLTALEALNSFATFIGRSTTSFAPDAEPIAVKPDGTGAIIENVPFAVSPVQSKVVYVQENGRLKLGWELTVEMEDSWYSTVVDAVSGDVVSVNDWVADSSYNVYPFGVNDPEDGARTVVTNPEDLRASPHGWNDQGTKLAPKKFTTTKGNNVWAQENLSGSTLYWEGNARPDGGDDLTYNFPLSLYSEPATYLDAAITQLFYTNNKIHDLFYLYGFDEVSGNFQDNNYAKGGLGGDGVIANAQDGSGKSNANFATPPDGQRGKMRMYTWTPSVERDGDLEAGIVIHEYAHGISNRLTGGPANSNCLGTGEAGGMGEGWGDFFATLIRQKSPSRTKPFPMGAYSARNANGIRKYPYSPDFTVNPETYSYIRKSGYEGVHAKGEVWANILYEAFLNLADDFGFDKDLSNPASSAGNVVILQNVVDGMKLQPCLPTFVDARDAILLADVVNYGGKHLCQLWTAFAKRGLGEDAKAGGYDGFKIPASCEVTEP